MHYSSNKLQFFLFADDTNLLYSDKNLKSLEKVVNKELTHVSDWLNANKLTLNIKKSNFVLFHPYIKKPDYISDQSPQYSNVMPLYFTQNSNTKNNFNYKQNKNVTPPPQIPCAPMPFAILFRLTVQADKKFHWIWTASKKIQASEQQKVTLMLRI